MQGLYAYQRLRIGWVGLIGSVLYGVGFIYFTHTTMIALEQAISNYEMLLGKLGGVYTFHRGLMVAGGTKFGVASLRAKVLWQGAVILFLVGMILNLGVALLPLPDILQILGISVRNLGLIAMAVSVIQKPVVLRKSAT